MAEYEAVQEEELKRPPPPDYWEQKSYDFDNFFVTNPMAKVYCLTAANIFFMIIFGTCFHLAGSQDGDIVENFWMGFTFAADMAEDDHGGPFPYWHEWIFRIMNVVFSFGGATIFGMVISFLSSAIDDRVDGLRRGLGPVYEKGHTLVIGWTAKTLPLVLELCDANSSAGGKPILILADMDKIEMDDFLMEEIDKETRAGSKIITRSGSPIEPFQLVKCAAPFARSIIVLTDAGDPDEMDAATTRVVLALTGGMTFNGTPICCHVSLEIQDIDNADVAMLGVLDETKRVDTVIPLVSADVIGKLMVICSREIGLNQCFQNLFCFAGSECYFSTWDSGCDHHEDGMTGKSFLDALYRFEDAACFGVRFANVHDPLVQAINPSGRCVMLNPPGDYIMQLGDKVLVLAEDDDTYAYGPSMNLDRTPVPAFDLPSVLPEKVLLAGWRRDFDDFVHELDKWLPMNSSLTLMSTKCSPEDQKQTLEDAGCFGDKLTNVKKLEFVEGDPCNGKALEMLGPSDPEYPADLPDRNANTSYRLEQFDLIINLSEEDKAGENKLSADSRVMVSMLIMAHICESRERATGRKRQGKARTMVAEILDPRTNDLMKYTRMSDGVVGNVLVAQMLAQLSEDRDIGYVFEDLFSGEGQGLHLKDIRLFVGPNELLCWWEIIGRAIQRNIIPVGWARKAASHPDEIIGSNDDFFLNPGPVSEDDCGARGLNAEFYMGLSKNTRLSWVGEDGPNGDQLVCICGK